MNLEPQALSSMWAKTCSLSGFCVWWFALMIWQRRGLHTQQRRFQIYTLQRMFWKRSVLVWMERKSCVDECLQFNVDLNPTETPLMHRSSSSWFSQPVSPHPPGLFTCPLTPAAKILVIIFIAEPEEAHDVVLTAPPETSLLNLSLQIIRPPAVETIEFLGSSIS